MKLVTRSLAAIALLVYPSYGAVLLSENFDNIAAITGSGWVMTNNSSPAGTTNWFQGNTTPFTAHAGASDSYIAANFENAALGGNISNWLFTPNVTVNNGFVLSFYTRTETGSAFPDRLQVRLSLNGASTNVGGTATSVGDFTTLLLDINPLLSSGVYPETWALQTVTLSGLSGATSARIGFRYFVSDTNNNGNYIGIDTVSLDDAVPEPSSSLLAGLALAGLALCNKRRKQ